MSSVIEEEVEEESEVNEEETDEEEEEKEEKKQINTTKSFKSDECVICLTNSPNILFCSCGHMAICKNATKNIFLKCALFVKYVAKYAEKYRHIFKNTNLNICF